MEILGWENQQVQYRSVREICYKNVESLRCGRFDLLHGKIQARMEISSLWDGQFGCFPFSPSRNSTRKVPWSNVMPMVSEKPSIRTSNAAIVFTSVAERPSATNTRRHHAHHHVIIWSAHRFASLSFLFIIAEITEKKEVKACYQCKGADACRPERLDGSEIRTSSLLGASNLYCYTVG